MPKNRNMEKREKKIKNRCLKTCGGKPAAARAAALIAALVFILFYIPGISADTSNANGTNTSVNAAEYAFFRRYEYGYRVSVYAGAEIKSYPSSESGLGIVLSGMSLSDFGGDFIRIGQVDLVNTAMAGHISNNTYVGGRSKIDYRDNGFSFSPVCAGDTAAGGGYCFWVWDLPVFDGEDGIFSYFSRGEKSPFSPEYLAVEEEDEEIPVSQLSPERFFLSRTVLSALLKQISFEETGSDDWWGSLFAGEYPVEFRRGSAKLVCGEGISKNEVDPSAGTNIVPFAVVYEPLVLCYLRGSADSALLTATEYALSQGSFWNWFFTSGNSGAEGVWPANGNHRFGISGRVYDYSPVNIPTGGKTAQAVQSLVFGSLPASVYLDRNWFGHPAFSESVTDAEGNRIVSYDGRWWSVQAAVEYGGWGMEFFAPVKSPDAYIGMDLSVAPVLPNAGYVSGFGTVLSFTVSNRSATRNVYPGDGVKLRITVRNKSGAAVFTDERPLEALPAGATSTVWTGWKVPDGMTGGITVTGELIFPEEDDISPGNDSCSFSAAASPPTVMSAADPGYSGSTMSAGEIPGASYDTASWTEWSWDEDEGFVRSDFRVRISSDAVCQPDPASNAVFDPGSGSWTVRSGYGFFLEVSAVPYALISRGGGSYEPCDLPDGEVSPVQSAVALFPEHAFAETDGAATTMVSAESGSGLFILPENSAAGGKRIHYIPVNYPDGEENYSPAVVLTQCWTPAGMIGAVCPAQPLSVSGSLFDDWYAGR